MSAESIKLRTFAILWDKAQTEGFYIKEVQLWLRTQAWDELFPGHCFTCHMSEYDPCKPAEHLSCPGCTEARKEHELMLLQAKMDTNELRWKILEGDKPLTKQQVEAILSGASVEEMKKLKKLDPAWTHGGSRADCVGGPCGCPEAAHE